MKKLLVLGALFTAMAYPVTAASQWQPFAKANVGLVGGAVEGLSAGLNLGAQHGNADLSISYSRLMGTIESDHVESNGADINLVGGEAGYSLFRSAAASARVAAGVGMAMTDLNGRDKADNEVYGTVGASLIKRITDSIHIELGLSGLFLKTRTTRTDYGSHFETLSTGGSVEVLDEFPKENSLGLNSATASVTVVLKF